jgi:hypothetical protein
MTSAANDTATAPAPNSDDEDVITRLAREHRDVEGGFQAIEADFGHASDAVVENFRQVVADLVRQSVAEEVHLYPLVRERLEGGDAIADRMIWQNHEAEKTMKAMESLPLRGVDFWHQFKILTNLVRQHSGEQEMHLLPELRRVLSADELVDLGRKMAATERTAPTRPHPNSPTEGGALAALAPGAGLVDRLRDAFSSHRPR